MCFWGAVGGVWGSVSSRGLFGGVSCVGGGLLECVSFQAWWSIEPWFSTGAVGLWSKSLELVS